MRTLLLAAAALIASGSAALAAPAEVSVAVGPELQAKAAKTYGVRDVDQLADYLKTRVERSLARSGGFDGARIQLTLTDAVPNRPTFKQLGDVMGLSAESFGVGGATIDGHAILPDGHVVPLSYSWYETDIRQSVGTWTWHDAEWAMGRFAYDLGRGSQVASR